MPLLSIPASEVTRQRKANPLAKWGGRGNANRVEPIALPGFDVPFQFEPGEAIFTVGSCFARNVESALAARGFTIPAREIFKRPEFADLETAAINNYGAPSIYNEFAWAFGVRPYNPDDHILEIGAGKYADQHISPSLRPEARELVLARRAAISDSYRAALQSRIVIMTLGLSEVWFDTATGYYLNVSPRPTALRDFPDRYELHVLSYEEVYRYLEDALLLLKEHGRSDLRVILTVSPVPLTLTQRPGDVMVANCYSKSVLRAAAEAVVTKFDFVTYYPSYESVTLSDRKLAWRDDMIHVTDNIVRINVDRMVDAFAGSDPDAEKLSIENGGEAVAIVRARKAREGGGEAAARFFEEFSEWSARSQTFAAEHARFLLGHGRAAEALRILEAHGDKDDVTIAAMICEALLGVGRTEEALQKIGRLSQNHVRAMPLWANILSAAFATDSPDIVLAVLADCVAVAGKSATPFVMVGRFFRDRNDPQKAIQYYRMGLKRSPSSRFVLELVEILIGQQQLEESRTLLKGVKAESASEARRLRSLTERLDPG